jgi:hypothetical protein
LKDQYVGDVNDFAKYQLLRLAEAHFERVLVAWMLTTKDDKSDGGKIAYLDDPRNGAADPALFEALTALVGNGRRSVAALERCGVLPGCSFQSAPMPSKNNERTAYFEALAARANPNTLVFLDPDNGIEVASVAMGRSGAERYVYWSELGLLRDTGSSLLVYQHFPRVQRAPYLDGLLARLSATMSDGYELFAAYTARVGFLFALREEHRALREAVTQRCEESPLLRCHG